jgi:large subunit ribosomal protein L11
MPEFVRTTRKENFNMAGKPIKAQVKLQLPAGKATAAPPVGSTLGPHGINLPMFVKQFNEATQKDAAAGLVIPVIVTIYTDRTFEFVLKTPPAGILIKQVLALKSGSAKPNTDKVGKITREQIRKIAEQKMVDLNTTKIESAESMIKGSARSMGVTVVE